MTDTHSKKLFKKNGNTLANIRRKGKKSAYKIVN